MPNWKDLKRFCDRDGWEIYKQTDHWYYQKIMPDGQVKRTKVSMGTGEIKKNLWRQIREKQLQVSQEYFNKFS
ncbi:MAG: type II toxin-antitoxin system HicA family toxin [Syntrophomonas sp.]